MLLIALSTTAMIGCKKDVVGPSGPSFKEFSLEVASNPSLQSKVSATIEGNNVYVRVPNVLDITKIVPSFITNDAKSIVYVGDKVQESGISEVDFSANSLEYRIVTENGAATFNVQALRNAAILSFGFYAEDNDGVLFRDYPATIQGLNVSVEIPTDADITKLVGRFTTSSGAVVKVGNQVQESKVSVQSFANPLTFAVTDAETATPQNYVVTVGRLTAPVWSKVNSTVLDKAISSIRLAINPITNNPYVIYNLSSVTGGVDSDRKAVAAYLENGTWNFLGASTGFSGARVDLVSIAFDNLGTPYAAYKDIESGQTWNNKPTVQKYTEGSWAYVGTRGLDHVVSYLDIAVGSNNVPVLGYTLGNNTGMTNRGTMFRTFASNAWSTGVDVVAGSTSFFSRTFTGDDGKVYYVFMDLTPGSTLRKPTLYKYNNGSWSVVGTSLVSPATDIYGAILVDAAVAENGHAYLVFQSQATADKKAFVMHYDGTSWKKIGDDILFNSSSNPQRDNIALAVHPNGTLYFAYADANGLYATTFNTSTNNWKTPSTLATTYGDKLDIKISKDGIPYIATVIDNKAAIFKYDIPN